MKKVFGILLAISLVSVSVFGCAPKASESQDTAKESTESEAKEETEEPKSDASASSDIDVTGENTDFTVAFCTWIGYAPLYVAKANGYFDEYGINPTLTIIEDESQYASAMFSNSIQALGNTLDREVIHFAQGTPESVVFAMDESSGGDGIIASEEVKSVADLKGKVVALDKSSTAYFFFLTVLEANGVSEDDLEIVEMGSYDAGSAFISGSVDAAVTWEPWLSNASEREGGHVIATSKDYPKTIVDIMTVRSDFAEENPNVVKAFREAWYKAIDFCNENPDEADKIMAEGIGLDLQDVIDEKAGVTLMGREENKEFFDKSTEGNIYEVTQRAADFWKEKGIFDDVNIDEFIPAMN